jgi:hypothetical protein
MDHISTVFMIRGFKSQPSKTQSSRGNALMMNFDHGGNRVMKSNSDERRSKFGATDFAHVTLTKRS